MLFSIGFSSAMTITPPDKGTTIVGNRSLVQTEGLTSLGIISTLAGSAEFSIPTTVFGIAATAANLGVTQGVAVDAAGNLFISTGEHRVLKITTSTGIITLVAGTGKAGYNGNGGLATSALLAFPYGIALDKFENIFVADSRSYRIRRIAAISGIITTVAGSGSYSSNYLDPKPVDNIAATSSTLNKPLGVAVDTLGNIYITDTSNHRVRKVTASTGIITTIAGNGNVYGVPILPALGVAATASGFFMPIGLTVDTSGNVLFTDSFTNSIYKVTVSTGFLSLVAGKNSLNYGDDSLNYGASGDDISATSTLLNNPSYITTDAQGDIFFSDTRNNRIRKIIASTGIITVVAGNSTRSCSSSTIIASPSASICKPRGIAVDAAGSVYFNDRYIVRKITYSQVTPSTAVTLAPSMTPAVTSITMSPTAAISLPTPTPRPSVSLGIITTVAGKKPPYTSFPEVYGVAATSVRLDETTGIVVDAAGNLFFSTSDHRILKITASTGNITVIAGTGEIGSSGDGGLAISATLRYPYGIALDQFGNIFIATNGNIRKITVSTGIITTVLSQKDSIGVAVDKLGNIYAIEDKFNSLVRKVTASTGIITTIAGGGVLLPSTKKGVVATATMLFLPCGVAVDSFGNVYVTDRAFNSIYKITADTGLLTLVAGRYSQIVGYNGNDILATTAYLNYPTFITVDERGNIFFTDFDNNRIRKITASTGIITTVAGKSLIYYNPSDLIRCQSNDYNSDGQDALSALLCVPRGIAVDAAGSVYFCAGDNVRKVTFSEVTPSSAVIPTPSVAPMSSITVPPTAGATTPSASMPSAPVTSSTTASHITKKMHSLLILHSSLLILYLHRGA